RYARRNHGGGLEALPAAQVSCHRSGGAAKSGKGSGTARAGLGSLRREAYGLRAVLRFLPLARAEALQGYCRAFPAPLPSLRADGTFGHLGDGNLHYNVSAPEGVAPDVYAKDTAAINRLVHDSVARFGGSISAEHGLGQLKRDEIRRYKSPLELELMRKLNRAFDPHGIMNPGKVL